jgi:hypothetical protein
VVRHGVWEKGGGLRYYLSNAGPVGLEALGAAVRGAEGGQEFFAEAVRYLGLGQYETRSWDG